MLENIRKTVNDGITELIQKGDLTAAKLLSAGWYDKHILTDSEYINFENIIAEKEVEIKAQEETKKATNLLI